MPGCPSLKKSSQSEMSLWCTMGSSVCKGQSKPLGCLKSSLRQRRLTEKYVKELEITIPKTALPHTFWKVQVWHTNPKVQLCITRRSQGGYLSEEEACLPCPSHSMQRASKLQIDLDVRGRGRGPLISQGCPKVTLRRFLRLMGTLGDPESSWLFSDHRGSLKYVCVI